MAVTEDEVDQEQTMAGSGCKDEVWRVVGYGSCGRAADCDEARGGNCCARSYRAVAETGADVEAGLEGVAPRAWGTDR